MRHVMRACNPPWLSTKLSIIHDVAEPLATNTMSCLLAAHAFQKFSKAWVKFDLMVSIHGISSINTTFLRSEGSDDRCSSRASKASNQSSNLRNERSPVAPFSALAKLRSWVRCGRLCPPTNEKSYFSLKKLSTKNVFPTRRLPYTMTSSERLESMQRCSSANSLSLPIILLFIIWN